MQHRLVVPIKVGLKRWLPRGLVAGVARRATEAQVWLARLWLALCVGMTLPLPLYWRAAVKDRLALVGLLDYAGGSIRMHLAGSRQYGRLLACSKEPETVEWIETTMREGDVLYDIGANVGAYALIADASTRGRAHVYAFEPSAPTFAELCKNICLNGAGGRVFPLNVALADRTGLETLHYRGLQPGEAEHALGATPTPFAPAAAHTVMQYCLDDLVQHLHLPLPTHIKLDVDGTELTVLRGASAVLAQPRLRQVLVEGSTDSAAAQMVRDLLEAGGFELYRVQPHGATTTCNYLFARPLAWPKQPTVTRLASVAV